MHFVLKKCSSVIFLFLLGAHIEAHVEVTDSGLMAYLFGVPFFLCNFAVELWTIK